MIKLVQNTGRGAGTYEAVRVCREDGTEERGLFTAREWLDGKERAEKNPAFFGEFAPAMSLDELAAWLEEESQRPDLSGAMRNILGLAGHLGGLRKPPVIVEETPPPLVVNPTATFTSVGTYNAAGSSLVLTDTTVPASAPLAGRKWNITLPDGSQVLPEPTTSPYTLAGLGAGTGGEVVGLSVSLAVMAEDGGANVSAARSISITAPPAGGGVVAFMTYEGGSDWAKATATERWLRDQIISWGYTVRKIEDAKYPADVLVGDEAVILVSSSIAAGAAGGWWTGRGWNEVNVPMLIMDTYVPPLEGMASSSTQIKVNVVERTPLLSPACTVAPGPQAFLTKPQEMSILADVSPHAQVILHVVGDRSQPVAILHERGEPMTSGQAPARLAYWSSCRETVYDQLNEIGLQTVRDMLAWCAADPGMVEEGPVALLTVSQAYSIEDAASVFHGTDASTAPAGRTIVERLWTLRDASGGVVATESGANYTTPEIPNGQFHQLDLTVTDSAGVSRTKRAPLYAEAPYPTAGFTFTRTDQSPSQNVISAVDSSRSPNRIVEQDWWLYQTDGTTLVSESINGSDTYQTPPLLDGTYILRHRVENLAGLEAVYEQVIAVPTPPARINVDVMGTGTHIYAYNKTEPAAGTTITATEWDFDLSNPGTLTAVGLHPGLGDRDGKPQAPGIGTFNGQVTIRQSNMSVTVVPFQYTTWEEKTWGDRGSQDYVTPQPVATFNRTLYFDADNGVDDAAHTALSPDLPKRSMAALSGMIKAGDRVYLKGDFGYGTLFADNLKGSETVNTLITRWPGAPEKPKLAPGGENPTIDFDGSTFLWIVDLDLSGLNSVGNRKWCVMGRNSSQRNIVIQNCSLMYATAGVRLTGRDHWVDGCFVDMIGTGNETYVTGNGGNGIQLELGTFDCTIVRNTLRRCGHICIELLIDDDFAKRQWRVRVAHNDIANGWAGTMGIAGAQNCLFEENDYHDIGWTPQATQFTIGSRVGINVRGESHTFRFNRIWHVARNGNQIQSNFNGGRQITRRNHIYHNTYYDCGYEGPTYYSSLNIQDGSGGADNIYMEDNLYENENFVDNHAFQNGTLPSAIYIVPLAQTDWIRNNSWGGIGNPPPSHMVGNTLRNSNIHDSSGVTQKWIAYSNGGDVKRYYYTLPEIPLAFSEWTGNREEDPLFLSVNPADPDFLVLDAASPLYNAGRQVDGITYPNGNVPIGWYPAN